MVYWISKRIIIYEIIHNNGALINLYTIELIRLQTAGLMR
jgi:hypothetical protein